MFGLFRKKRWYTKDARGNAVCSQCQRSYHEEAVRGFKRCPRCNNDKEAK